MVSRRCAFAARGVSIGSGVSAKERRMEGVIMAGYLLVSLSFISRAPFGQVPALQVSGQSASYGVSADPMVWASPYGGE